MPAPEQFDIAEAIGKITAVICIQSALVTALTLKRILSVEDIAEIAGFADTTLNQMDVSESAKGFAKDALRGFVQPWTQLISKH